MTYEEAIKFLHDHHNEMIDTAENLVKWGDCIVAISDHVSLLDGALTQKQGETFHCFIDVDYEDDEWIKTDSPVRETPGRGSEEKHRIAIKKGTMINIKDLK